MHATVGEHGVAVHPGAHDPGLEALALKGGPATFGEDVRAVDRPRRRSIDQDEIRMIAFTDEAPLGDVEQAGRCMAHLLDHLGQGEDTLPFKFEHGHERMLDKGSTGRPVPLLTTFLMRRAGK